MVVHVALLAVPAAAAAAAGGGFMQAFHFAFVLWPLNLALPLARHLPRACVALRRAACFYAAELRRCVGVVAERGGARLMMPPPPPPRSHQYSALLRGGGGARQRMDDEMVAQTMVALVDIAY
ncbi:hypothetical protein ACP4OV_016244 [Aristida adscensionis]